MFDKLKKYQRPFRTVLWTILIALAFVGCLFFNTCNESRFVETILIAMFTDMGIYTVGRTIEKIKNLKDE